MMVASERGRLQSALKVSSRVKIRRICFRYAGGGGAVAGFFGWVLILVVIFSGLGGVLLGCWKRLTSFADALTCFMPFNSVLEGHQMREIFSTGLLQSNTIKFRHIRGQGVITGLTLNASRRFLMTVRFPVRNQRIFFIVNEVVFVIHTANLKPVSLTWYRVVSLGSTTWTVRLTGLGGFWWNSIAFSPSPSSGL